MPFYIVDIPCACGFKTMHFDCELDDAECGECGVELHVLPPAAVEFTEVLTPEEIDELGVMECLDCRRTYLGPPHDRHPRSCASCGGTNTRHEGDAPAG